MFRWINTSLNRKIGSVLVVSLSFLLLVIGYSIYQVKTIHDELKEVSQVDIPLTEIITQIETLQLQQHIAMERFRLLINHQHKEQEPISSLSYRNQEIVRLLNRATQLITTNLQNDTIHFKPEEYLHILDEINTFYKLNLTFEKQLEDNLEKGQLSDETWQPIEVMASHLDTKILAILEKINQLTFEATRYTEAHQRSFMMVETGLGICAFLLSSLLALYIIHIIRTRIHHIHQQVEQLHTSLELGEPIAKPNNQTSKPNDELGELELDLKKMISRLSEEMNTRKEVEQQLMTLATKDKLTNTYNRHKWSEQIHFLINLSEQGKSFSLISLDIDHFKRINDSYGHQVGDQVLQHLGTLLQQEVSKIDMVFRMGGEEFLILLTGQGQKQAKERAEHLRKQIEHFQKVGLPRFTASLGVTSYHSGETEDSLMTRADNALYRSKENGRNCVTTLE
ncbi:GGDEF domain-containing protein [Marinomonas posidonica]|uniref:diguanylate cyclase n=1 Tax=Marinomonas posidonica (strain CECT 7376 / NCIMB 14433 / IVIA-Po-181) TaxID=491952 RepID=F6CS31_MARPP|nr:GGDEF domain-containing protein [Marinomonas posidonica]AEF56138.1 diguanylate cyclase [Marinomonas posidonica IVIA-Po-181]